MTFKDTLAACFYQIAMCNSRLSHLTNFLFWHAKSEFSGKAPTKQESNHWWFYLIPFLLSYIVRVKPLILVRILPAALVVPVLRAQNQNRNLIPDKKVSLPTKRKRGMYESYFLRKIKILENYIIFFFILQNLNHLNYFFIRLSLKLFWANVQDVMA